MLRIEHNLKEVQIELSEIARDLPVFFKHVGLESKDAIPKLKAYMKKVLERQLTELQFIHSSDAWRVKKQEMLAGEIPTRKFERMQGQGPRPVEYAENWKATGTMQAVLLHRMDQMKPSVTSLPDMLMIGFPISLEGFVDSDDKAPYGGIPYPMAVDMKIQDRTSGEQGIFRLSDQQRKEIFEFMVDEIDEWINRFFPESGAPAGLEIG